MEVYGKVLNIRILDHTAFVKLRVIKVVLANGTVKPTDRITRFSLAYGIGTPIREEDIKLLFEGDMLTMYLEQMENSNFTTTDIKVDDDYSLGDAISEACL